MNTNLNGFLIKFFPATFASMFLDLYYLWYILFILVILDLLSCLWERYIRKTQLTEKWFNRKKFIFPTVKKFTIYCVIISIVWLIEKGTLNQGITITTYITAFLGLHEVISILKHLSSISGLNYLIKITEYLKKQFKVNDK